MSPNLKAVETLEGAGEDADNFTEELPSITRFIDPTSFDSRLAGIESCSVVRELTKHWSTVVAFQFEEEKRSGAVDAADTRDYYERRQKRMSELWAAKRVPRPPEQMEEHIKYIKSIAVRFVDWGDIGQLWNADPAEALSLWRAMRLEARDEFISGHYGARAFENAD